MAAGSLSEIIEHLNRARRKNLITTQETTDLQLLARRARGAATGLIRYLQSAEPPHLPPKRHRPPSKPKEPREKPSDATEQNGEP
jgi:hypothetical protein